ncbi:MAG TPA: hypothetical protein VMV81_05440 [Phycisphaerae bacterium]|nr:hypothetical protein [Phycisphaerae bacterium]
MSHRRLIVVSAFFSGLAGCMQPLTPATSPSASPAKSRPEPTTDDFPLESNIVRVNKFFNSDPWLSFESDGTNKVDGVRFSIYLEGPSSPKGVFGTGRIVVTMYRIETDPTGKETAAQLYEWDLPPEKAYPWRAKNITAMGWGYGMRLRWEKPIDISGRQIAFVVKYIREDGRVITSSRQVVKGPGGPDAVFLTRTREANKAPAAGHNANVRSK